MACHKLSMSILMLRLRLETTAVTVGIPWSDEAGQVRGDLTKIETF